MIREIWKPVRRYKGLYEVSNLGRVRSLDRTIQGPRAPQVLTGRMLSQYPSESGHLSVTLNKEGKRKGRLVHRLVLEAFVGPCPPGMQARHFPDRDPANNRLTNLSWSDQFTNQRDRVLHGTAPRGDKNGRTVAPDKRVRALKRKYESWTGSQRAFARVHAASVGLSEMQVRFIVSGRSRVHT